MAMEALTLVDMGFLYTETVTSPKHVAGLQIFSIPENYPGNEVPTSEMAQDWLTTYKYGWKTSYYQNTYDAKKDAEEPIAEVAHTDLNSLLTDIMESNEEECESCSI